MYAHNLRSSCATRKILLFTPRLVGGSYLNHRLLTSKDAYHRFVPEESDWGFTAKFYDLRKLYLPVDGKSRPMIEDDSVTFKAFVRIIKDETGVLWHKFIKYVLAVQRLYV